MAKTEQLILKDGSKVVRKVDRGYGYELAKDAQDAEELASVLGRGLGMKVPEVARISKNTIVTEFSEGRLLGMEAEFSGADIFTGLTDEEITRLGLLDTAMANADRNTGNWLVEHGRVIPIDHGQAFMVRGSAQQTIRFMAGPMNPFSGRLFHETTGTFEYSVADVDRIRLQVRVMHGEFTRLNHEDWYQQTLDRLDYIESKARGRKKVF
jgi:hypothetical protein